MNLKSGFLQELNSREFIYQHSNLEGLDAIVSSQKIHAYIGFDCTADSLHVGSLVQIMTLRKLQQHGHTPVILLGGGTSLIGDPSGKDKSRQMLTKEQIEANKQGIKSVISKFIDNSNALFVDNNEWLTKFNYLEFLRDYGVMFTINRMLTFDSVKTRLERQNPLTFLEFNYMLLQAVDYLHLFKTHNTLLQLGGSDQWSNILNGVELVRKVTSKEVFALTSPLVTNSNGTKMGKTEQGAIWLSEDKISTWNYYQFWRNVEDTDVIKFLKLFTEVPITTIENLQKLQGKELNKAKKLLAFEATKLCFGKNEAEKNQNTATELFEKGNLSNDLPTETISTNLLNSNITISDLMVHLNLTTSKNEARKLIANNGVKINDTTINNSNLALKISDFNNNTLKLSIGKKKHLLVKLD